MKKLVLILAFTTTILQAQESKKNAQDKIIAEFSTNCAQNTNYISDMVGWQECLDIGLKKDSTIAYLWQQKAMPYFKARKYQIGMKYLEKAVKYDELHYLPYRAFIKCIFSKDYIEAILDFENCKKKFGNNYVMDHTYDFYIALCYLQLNEYHRAEFLLEQYVNDVFKVHGEEWVHPTALFYLGISKFEQENFKDAISTFDRALKLYPNFSDVEYYKAICLSRSKNYKDVKTLLAKAKKDFEAGATINEDNVLYERYPYQVRWGL